MAEKVREILTDVSIYVKGLDSEARKRYFSKLMFDKGLKTLPDPYKVPDEKWSRDLTNWPSLDFGQLYTYLILSPALFNPTSMRNYKSLEAYRYRNIYVESKHVQVVHYYNVEESPYCFLRAAVTPSMRTRDEPHSAWVCLEKVSAEVYCAHCTCMAGLGETCSHVAAILFKVELAVRWRYTEKSSTDVGRMWNQHFKEQVDPSPVTKMQHLFGNRKKKVESVNTTSRDPLPSEEQLKALYAACPNASFFNLIPSVVPNQKLAPPIREDPLPLLPMNLYNKNNENLPENELRSKAQDIISSTKVTSDQDRTSLLCGIIIEKEELITATKAHDVLTLKDSTCPDNLVMRVAGYKSYDLSKKDCVKWGLDNESSARDMYQQHVKSQHSNFGCSQSGLLVSETSPYLGATADGVVSCVCCGIGTLEIKCPFKHKSVMALEAAKCDKEFCLDKNLKLKQKHRYYTQVQFQMLVYGVQYCDFVVLTQPSGTPSLVIIRVQRDSQFIDNLEKKCNAFLSHHLLPELMTSKLRNKQVVNTPTEDVQTWCICEEREYGKMILCSNEDCQIGWCHYGCVNVKRKPRGRWLCPRCKK
ncbi:ING4-like protein [Mya arenaria]|uniref:ING4-like protein n=1 Tax=Mya arenaria TaxID=6604 RepID=A0ABY7DME0_MYAAR|nr:ING4-like protein [Mya arenaria]